MKDNIYLLSSSCTNVSINYLKESGMSMENVKLKLIMSNCYYIVQDYIDNVTAHIRVGPPVYFIVKDYNYRYNVLLYFIFVANLLLILTVCTKMERLLKGQSLTT